MRTALAGLAGALLLAGGLVLMLPETESESHRPQAPPRERSSLPVSAATIDPGAGVAAKLFVSPRGSDDSDCGRERPCLTFGRAYLAARPGDVVEVAEGRYAEQFLPADPGRESDADVVFRPAPRAEVDIGPVTFGGPRIADLGASHVTIRDMRIAGFSTQRSSDLTFLDLTVEGNFAVQGGAGIRVVGGSVGGTSDGSHSEIVAYFEPGTIDVARNVTIDGVVFHDVRMSRPEDHVECLQATDVVDLTVRNSRFVRCDTFDLRIDRYRTRGPRGVVVENSVFQQTRDRFGGNVYYGLAVRAGADMVIRNNSSDMAWAGPEPGTPVSDWLVTGNAMPGGRCDDRISYRHNLWDGGARCHPSDALGAARFADPGTGDFRLRPTSPAIDLGDAALAPERDHQRRLRDRRPDAGAFEASPPPS